MGQSNSTIVLHLPSTGSCGASKKIRTTTRRVATVSYMYSETTHKAQLPIVGQRLRSPRSPVCPADDPVQCTDCTTVGTYNVQDVCEQKLYACRP